MGLGVLMSLPQPGGCLAGVIAEDPIRAGALLCTTPLSFPADGVSVIPHVEGEAPPPAAASGPAKGKGKGKSKAGS